MLHNRNPRERAKKRTNATTRESSSGVSFVVGFLQSLGGHMRVNLRGGKARMTQHLLYAAKISSPASKSVANEWRMA